MHDMPYEDSSFDVVFLGPLNYSDERPKAARETLRVARDGAIVAVMAGYEPCSDEEIERRLSYLPGSRDRIKTFDDLLTLFEGHVGHIYFAQDPLKVDKDNRSTFILIFSVKKPKGGSPYKPGQSDSLG